jgi:hypothetical protein
VLRYSDRISAAQLMLYHCPASHYLTLRPTCKLREFAPSRLSLPHFEQRMHSTFQRFLTRGASIRIGSVESRSPQKLSGFIYQVRWDGNYPRASRTILMFHPGLGRICSTGSRRTLEAALSHHVTSIFVAAYSSEPGVT